MFIVTCHPVVGSRDGFEIAKAPDLTSAVKLVEAIFRATKICSDRPVEMRQRAIPVGAAIEFYYPMRNRTGVDRSNFIMYFRCQELPDEREEDLSVGRPGIE